MSKSVQCSKTQSEIYERISPGKIPYAHRLFGQRILAKKVRITVRLEWEENTRNNARVNRRSRDVYGRAQDHVLNNSICFLLSNRKKNVLSLWPPSVEKAKDESAR